MTFKPQCNNTLLNYFGGLYSVGKALEKARVGLIEVDSNGTD